MHSMIPKSRLRTHAKGQNDHVDAWLISYADLITLLFMVFVILVSITSAKPNHSSVATRGEPEHPYLQHRSGSLELGTPFDEAYRIIAGIVATHQADQSIALEKTDHSVIIDLSVTKFFEQGSADIPLGQLPLLQLIANALKTHMVANSIIEVEGHTDDAPPIGSPFANDWELSSMRAARIASQLAQAGIDPTSLRATGYAGNHPLVPNKDLAGHDIAKNHERNQRMIIKLEMNPDLAPPKLIP